MSEHDAGAVWRNTNFRWLWTGSAVSMLGDQFTLIALPWLVLALTHDPLALGGVLAAMNAPRAVFMLVGGAIVDRHEDGARRILLATRCASVLFIGLLGVLVLTGRAAMPAIYALAAAIGLCTAFSYPAGSALLPGVLPPALLARANGILMAMGQFALLVGPVLAGLFIAGAGGARAGLADARGLGLAFLLDAASFLAAAATLARVRPRAQPQAGDRTAATPALLAGLAAGVRYCLDDATLRTCFLYWGALALFVAGPLQVALPVLATRLGGAGAYGSLVAAHGAGVLAGMVLAGLRPDWRIGGFGTTLLAADGTVGLMLVALSGVAAMWQGMALLLAVGVLGGYLQAAMMTWLQRRLRADMLGRGMALLMFVVMGLAPLSAAVTGWLLRATSLATVLAGAGLATLAVVAAGLSVTRLRRLAEA